MNFLVLLIGIISLKMFSIIICFPFFLKKKLKKKKKKKSFRKDFSRILDINGWGWAASPPTLLHLK